MTPPRTWTLTDGHAGNVHQATALAHALALPAQDWTLQPRPPWQWLAPWRLPGSALAFGTQFHAALNNPPELAIGCGRQAALATRELREHGARAIQILDPRIHRRHWDLVIAPTHDPVDGPNVLTLLGSLNPVDEIWLAYARQQFIELSALPGPRTSVLIGGPSAHASLHIDDIHTMFSQLEASVRAQGGTLMVVTSRRTPAQVVMLLRQRLANTPHLLWCSDADGANPYAGVLAWADRIVCTADSVNMLSEACATHVPVYVHAPERVSGRVQSFLTELLSHRGRIRPLATGLTAFPVTPLRETARIARLVRQRLGLASPPDNVEPT